MKIITGNRGSGVTSSLLTDAVKSGKAVYVCPTQYHADTLKKKFKDSGVLFVTLYDIKKGCKEQSYDEFQNAPIYIDDFDYFLKSFLRDCGFNGELTMGATW